jgi:hypothetical protein
MSHGLLLLGLLLVGQAEAPAGQDLGGEVRRLVRRLDDASLEVRDAAEAELLRLGPDILDLLPAPSERTSAEVRQRLGRVRQKLQQQAADATARSSTVTLRADAMPLLKVLAEFQRQTGNKIVDYREHFGQPTTDAPLTIHCDKTPFWQALDEALNGAKLAIYPFVQERAIHVVAAPDAKNIRRGCNSGPFRFEPASLVARRELRGGEGVLMVNVEVLWEPRLRIIGMTQRLADVTAVDQRGRALPVADRDAQFEISADHEAPAARLDLPLQLPPRDALRIAVFKGKLQAMIAGKVETFRFNKPAEAKNVEQRIAGVMVTLEEVRKNNEAWEVRMRVRFDDAGDALESHRTWIFNNEARLEGPDGKPIAYDTYETTRQDKNEVGVAYLFSTDQPIDKLTFVYKTPGVIVSRAFEYELKDMELP